MADKSKKKSKLKKMPCYNERRYWLSVCGYASYQDYLQSPEWQEIRGRVLEERSHCVVCKKTAEQVHHLNYMSGTLLGLWLDQLIPLCRSCHYKIEFSHRGTKRTLPQANEMLFKFLKQKGKDGLVGHLENLQQTHKLKNTIAFKKNEKQKWISYLAEHKSKEKLLDEESSNVKRLREQAAMEEKKRQDDMAWLEDHRKSLG